MVKKLSLGFQKNNSGCKKCLDLGCSISNTPYLYEGKSFDGTIIIGESPHKSWKESGSPFLNANQKLNPSGKRIFEYLELLEKNKDSVVLLEAVKCVVENRNSLKIMMKNCTENLLKEINCYHPRLVISLGKLVCENLGKIWNIKVEPCNIYKINGFIFIPLYHPSPINPNNHTKNIRFLQENKNLIGL